MKSPVLLTLLTTLSVSNPDRDSVTSYSRHLLRPEVTARWLKEANRDCRSSSAECLPAYLSAKYSEVAMWACREAAGAPFEQQHGGNTTTYAQNSIRRTCQEAIQACRSAWRHVDAITFRDSESPVDPRRLVHFEQFLIERCGADPSVSAPF